MISKRTFLSHLFWLMGLCALISCQNTPASSAEIPTLMAVAVAELEAATATPPGFVPPTYTAVPLDATIIPTPSPPRLVQSTPTPAILPTITPIPPTLTPSITPTPTITPTATIKPLADYRLDEPLPPEAYPRPQDDNGWGMHWIPTVSQEPAVVDRFVGEMVRMHIK